MKISILGLGWFGAPLGKELTVLGHEVLGTTRSIEKIKKLKKNKIDAFKLDHPESPTKNLLNADIIVLNIPPFPEQLEWFKSWEWSQKSWIIFISSTSILKEEENWIQSSFTDWTIVRFGGLLGPDRHPGKYLSGRKNLMRGQWPVNLIHLDDCIGVTKAIIKHHLKHDVFNVVCDEHPTREDFYTKYCTRMNLPLPHFDSSDKSTRDPVDNAKIKNYYPHFRELS